MTLETFTSKFAFNPDLAFYVGVEREFFLTDMDGHIVPKTALVLPQLTKPLPRAGSYSYELSACQIESQSIPCVDIETIRQSQTDLDTHLDKILKENNLQKECIEVAPDEMPLDVFPDPEGRYGRLAEQMPLEILLAACQVTGTHFHIGMPDMYTALRVYNKVISHCDELSSLGDRSNGRRLEIYKQVAPECIPIGYKSWEDFYVFAQQKGFAENPRDCWHLIRMTVHGTIEFRNFGVTDSIDDVAKWAEYCRSLCLHYK